MQGMKPVKRTCRPFSEDSFRHQFGYSEINPEWIELAEQLKFLDESRFKIAVLEREIETLLSEKD